MTTRTANEVRGLDGGAPLRACLAHLSPLTDLRNGVGYGEVSSMLPVLLELRTHTAGGAVCERSERRLYVVILLCTALTRDRCRFAPHLRPILVTQASLHTRVHTTRVYYSRASHDAPPMRSRGSPCPPRRRQGFGCRQRRELTFSRLLGPWFAGSVSASGWGSGWRSTRGGAGGNAGGPRSPGRGRGHAWSCRGDGVMEWLVCCC